MDTPVQLFRVHPTVRLPMSADKSALGALPLQAFQYCEAMRAASASGWYVFPPEDIALTFDGYQVFVADDGTWRPLIGDQMPDTARDGWATAAPEQYRDHAPNMLTALSDPGMVQIWSGFFIKTAPGYSVLVRPLVNIHKSASFYCFEASIETDSFWPCPLFMNVKIAQTGVEIIIEKGFPLFQMQVIKRDAVFNKPFDQADVTDVKDDAFPWDQIGRTLRIEGVTEPRKAAGSYGAGIRRKNRTSGT